jgi:hypothetical protein
LGLEGEDLTVEGVAMGDRKLVEREGEESWEREVMMQAFGE